MFGVFRDNNMVTKQDDENQGLTTYGTSKLQVYGSTCILMVQYVSGTGMDTGIVQVVTCVVIIRGYRVGLSGAG